MPRVFDEVFINDEASLHAVGLTKADIALIKATAGAPIQPPQAFVDFALMAVSPEPDKTYFFVTPDSLTRVDSQFNPGSAPTMSFPMLIDLSGPSSGVQIQVNPYVTRIELPRLIAISGVGATCDVYQCPILTSISIPVLEELSGTGANLDFTGNNLLSELEFSALQRLSGTADAGNGWNGATLGANQNPLLTSIRFPLLSQISGDGAAIYITSNDLLQEISLPLLENISGGPNNLGDGLPACALLVTGNPTLSLFSLPSLSRLDGESVLLDWSENALNVATVNALLATVVAAANTSNNTTGTLNLSGGTNAAPTGQGLTDKATLISNGWTVTTN